MALLIAAAPSLAQGVQSSEHTGLTGAYSSEMQVAQQGHFAVYAQASVVRRGNQVALSVFLRQGLNDGSWIAVDEAWSHGRRLEFAALPPDRTCGGLQCLYNMGILSFSSGQFAANIRSGIALRLITAQGPIDLDIPAQLFAEAATEAAAILN